MKQFFLVTLILLSTATAASAEYVSGYTKSNGTYVNGYNRSDANNTVRDNYSYQGNTNPYTGSVGTNNYQHDTTSQYYNGTPDNNGRTGHRNNNSLFGN